MDTLLAAIGDSAGYLPSALAGVFLLLLITALYFFTRRARALLRVGKRPPLRPLRAFERLSETAGIAAESGRPLHISLGTGAVGDTSTIESMAALTLLDSLAGQAAAYDAHPVVTVGDATLLLAAQDRLRQAYGRLGYEEGYLSTDVQLIAPEPTAYAAGAMGLVSMEKMSGNVMVGAFGEEYLLLGEAGAHHNPDQVAGAADLGVLPLVYATSETPLLGEEMFAAGAYMGQWPSHIGSLFAQDWARLLIILVIIAGVVLASL